MGSEVKSAAAAAVAAISREAAAYKKTNHKATHIVYIRGALQRGQDGGLVRNVVGRKKGEGKVFSWLYHFIKKSTITTAL